MSNFPKPLSEVEHLSASGIETFRTCPRTWAASYLYGQKSKSNIFSDRGKVAHAVIESHVLDRQEEHDISIIPPQEIENLRRYNQEVVLRNSSQVLGVEHSFKIPWTDVKGIPPLHGYIDMVDVTKDGVLRITDHKTNRVYEGREDWERKIQPHLYLYVAPIIWPGYKRYEFRLGYVNLDVEPVVFMRTEESNANFLKELARVWNSMVFFATENGVEWGEVPPLENFPQRSHKYCNSCPVKNSCAQYHYMTSRMIDQIVTSVESREERYLRLDTARKILENEISDLKAEILEDIRKGGEILSGGYRFSQKTSKRRQVKALPLHTALDNFVASHSDPDHAKAVVTSRFEDLFSAKVGGIDKIIKDFPEIEKDLSRVVTSVECEPTLEIRKK